MSDYLIRPATEADVPALVDMRLALQEHIEGANAHLFRLTSESPSRFSQKYRLAMSDPESLIVITEEIHSAAPIAMAVGTISIREDLDPPKTGRIDNVWVEPQFRRRGICRSMIGKLVEFFEQFNIQKLVLDFVVGSEESENTWKKLGFQPVLTIAVASLEETKRSLDPESV